MLEELTPGKGVPIGDVARTMEGVEAVLVKRLAGLFKISRL